MSTPFVHSVLALAEEAKVRTSDLAREYGPRLETAAHDVEHKLEVWLGYVDEHLAHWEDQVIVEGKKVAYDAYRAAQDETRKLIDAYKTAHHV
jgi:hypothetical protein